MEENANNLEKANKYIHIEWTENESIQICNLFAELDAILYECQKNNQTEKIKAIIPAYQNLHDISLSIGLKQMILDISGGI